MICHASRLFLALIGGLLPLVVAAAPPDDAFQRAAVAYDEARYSEAIALYEDLLEDGYQAPELYFNLANAYFRAEQVGPSVLNYKRAEQLAPRDRDIRNNLAFVIDASGAVQAPFPFIERVIRRLSFPEWLALTVAAWWLLALYAGLVIIKQIRWGMAGTAIVILLCVALVGLQHWIGLMRKPEIVITQPGQEATFAPLETGSTAHFALPEGSTARIESKREGWYKVRVGDKSGWIKQSVATVVSPWTRSES